MAIVTVPTRDELDAFFAAYGVRFEEGARPEMRGVEAGTVNTTFEVNSPAGHHCLRIYEEQDEVGARSEAALLDHLSARGVSTPAPLRALDGAAVVSLHGKPAALFPWVSGTMQCQASVTATSARQVGLALAKVHLAGAPPGAALGEGRFGPAALAARCERVAQSIDRRAAELSPSLREEVSVFAARRDPALPSGLIHADLFRDNVLWQDGTLAALLDFESAHRGAFAFDLAVTLLAWSFADAFVPEVARAMVSAYREVRELSIAERAGLFHEARFACVRFTITRITDETHRVGKLWQRFVARGLALDALGEAGFRELVGV